MIVLNDSPPGPKTKAGIALPENDGHRKLILKILKPLKSISIRVFFISIDGSVNCLVNYGIRYVLMMVVYSIVVYVCSDK